MLEASSCTGFVKGFNLLYLARDGLHESAINEWKSLGASSIISPVGEVLFLDFRQAGRPEPTHTKFSTVLLNGFSMVDGCLR